MSLKLLLLSLSLHHVILAVFSRSKSSLFDRRGNGQMGDLFYYLKNTDRIAPDLMKNQNPRENCVFYVNSYNSTREKEAAIAFASIRNAQNQGSANTLYDAFDLDVAFGSAGTLMREASAAGSTIQRQYFNVTSGAYARHCRGTVWLITKWGAPIYERSIWLTAELPALRRSNSGVTAIYEIDPAEVEWAQIDLANNPNPNFHPRPYRGGQPGGARPPRDLGAIPYNSTDVQGVQAKIDEYAKYPDVANGYDTLGQGSPPQCNMDQVSGVPYNVFTGLFSKFCDATLNNPLNALSQIVDSRGNKIPPRKLALHKRTPPPNPDTYNTYSFALEWSGGNGACVQSCQEAFQDAATSPCGHTGGEQNIMTTSGSVNAGCGKYSWTINKPETPPAPPSVGPLQCNNADAFGNHGDINPGFQAQYVGWACAGTARKTIKPGQGAINFHTTTNGVSYNYNVFWLQDCKSTVSEMNAYKPIASDSDDNCLNLLQKVYKDCNNGGVGGHIDVGCVRYEFHP